MISWQSKLVHANLFGGNDRLVVVAIAILLTTNSPCYAASNQLQPVLKAIDPSLAKMDTLKSEKPQAAPSPNPYSTVNGAPLDDNDSSQVPTRINRFPASSGQDDSGGGFSPSAGQAPSESMIPSFDKPLPVSPNIGNDGSNNGQLWGTNQTVPGQGQGEFDQSQPANPQASTRLTHLEQLVFGATYPDRDLDARLDHVEREVLGATTSGQPLDRISKLESKVGGQGVFSSPPPTVATATPPAPRQFAPQLPQTPATYGKRGGGFAPNPAANGQGGNSGGFVPNPAANGQGGNSGGFVPNPAANGQGGNSGGFVPNPAADGQSGNSGGFVPNPAANWQGGNNGGFAPNSAANDQGGLGSGFAPNPGSNQQMQQYPGNASPPSSSVIGGADATRIIQAMPNNPKAGDYFSALKPIRSGQYARWNRFPVLVHLPQDSPDAWRRVLKQGVEKWNGLIPLTVAGPYETADIEMVWINHLPQTLLGITRLVVVSGRMHVQIFMLRPTFYNSDVPERALGQVFLHELGHGLGLFCHSETAQDVMAPCDGSRGFSKNPNISARDTNTLKRLYQSPVLDSDLTLPAPIEWGYSH